MLGESVCFGSSIPVGRQERIQDLPETNDIGCDIISQYLLCEEHGKSQRKNRGSEGPRP